MAATPIVYSIFATLWFDPVTTMAGGTELKGMDLTQPIRVVVPHGVELEISGMEADAVRSVKSPTPDRTRVLVPARGADVETLKLLFASNTSDGLLIVTDGNTIVHGGHPMRDKAAALRPLDATEKPWYFPRLQLDPDADAFMNAHPTLSLLDGASLVLVCTRGDSAAEPAGARGTAVALDALFGLGGGA